MKIVLIGGQCIPGIGGIESYVLNMAKSLTKQGDDVTIICCDRKSYTDTISGIEIEHIACPKSNTIALPLLFIKALPYIIKNRKHIDVINYQSIFFAFISGWIAKLCGCNVYYTIHSLAEDNPKHSKIMKFLMKATAYISIYCCGKNIITVSNSKANEIKSRYGKTCTVIPCGVNMPTEFKETNILTKFGINRGYYYLTIGRMDPIKNLDILIQAYIQRDNPKFQLVLAGDYSNSHGAYLRELAKDNKNIIFVGSVMGNDKDTLLKNSFANCLLSSSEGMPLSLLEAMSYGKPCIVSDIPAIREILRDDWGMWCTVRDIGSATNQIKIAEENYINIIDKSAHMATYIAKHHTWEMVASKYRSYIQNI